jgi:hypothetical protein
MASICLTRVRQATPALIRRHAECSEDLGLDHREHWGRLANQRGDWMLQQLPPGHHVGNLRLCAIELSLRLGHVHLGGNVTAEPVRDQRNKLARTFAVQLETLKRYRTEGSQI